MSLLTSQRPPEQLRNLAAFVRVAQTGSFTQAAQQLGVSPSALSQNLRSLETQLGVRLLNRSTRSVGLTEAGAAFLAQVLPGLAQIDAAFRQLDHARSEPAGTLRVILPRTASHILLTPLLGAFSQAYPQITLDLTMHDGTSDLAASGYDCGIHLGERLALDMVAVAVSPPLRMAVVGAPAYFEKHAVPQIPQDLHGHACIRFRFSSSNTLYRWEFSPPDAHDAPEAVFDLDLGGPLVTNDNATMREAALAGIGLAQVFEATVRDDLAAGRLVQVLAPWCAPFPGFFLYYTSRAQMPPKLRVFIHFLQAQMRGLT